MRKRFRLTKIQINHEYGAEKRIDSEHKRIHSPLSAVQSAPGKRINTGGFRLPMRVQATFFLRPRYVSCAATFLHKKIPPNCRSLQEADSPKQWYEKKMTNARYCTLWSDLERFGFLFASVSSVFAVFCMFAKS